MRRIFERSRLVSRGKRVDEIAERAQGWHCCNGEGGGWRPIVSVELGSLLLFTQGDNRGTSVVHPKGIQDF